MRALDNHQIVELFEKHRVVSAIPSRACCLFTFEWLLDYCASLDNEKRKRKIFPLVLPHHIKTCLYGYFSSKTFLVTITFQRLDSFPWMFWEWVGIVLACLLYSVGNTTRYTNYCKQMMQILYLSIYHTALLVTQGNLFNLHMIKERTQIEWTSVWAVVVVSIICDKVPSIWWTVYHNMLCALCFLLCDIQWHRQVTDNVRVQH